MKKFLVLSLVVMLVILPLYVLRAQAATLYVDLDGTDPNGGSCYKSIQQAIIQAESGDEIIVSKGIYNENIDFWGKNITIRSSDPNNPDIVADTVIDGGNEGYVASFYSAEDSNAVLSGFTLRNGNGIFCDSSQSIIVLLDCECLIPSS